MRITNAETGETILETPVGDAPLGICLSHPMRARLLAISYSGDVVTMQCNAIIYGEVEGSAQMDCNLTDNKYLISIYLKNENIEFVVIANCPDKTEKRKLRRWGKGRSSSLVEYYFDGFDDL